jgi:hypothetical protein
MLAGRWGSHMFAQPCACVDHHQRVLIHRSSHGCNSTYFLHVTLLARLQVRRMRATPPAPRIAPSRLRKKSSRYPIFNYRDLPSVAALGEALQHGDACMGASAVGQPMPSATLPAGAAPTLPNALLPSSGSTHPAGF